jgi:dipeptidyl aminopeptidase/acylaminoacyl peptidase
VRLIVSLALLSADLCAARPFTVADEIGLALFRNLNGGDAALTLFSPDGKYVAAYAERGRLDVNQVEGVLRIYRSGDLQAFLRGPSGVSPPDPLWTVTRLSPESPAIGSPQWLASSNGIAFLQRGEIGTNRLVLADMRAKTFTALTPDGQSVRAFDVRDATHYAYVLESTGRVDKALADHRATAVTLTGRSLIDTIFPADRYGGNEEQRDRGELWAAVSGRPVQIKDADGANVTLFAAGKYNLALSPDGSSLITALAVAEVPLDWEMRYPPPYPSAAVRLRAGKQDLGAFIGGRFTSEYVRIDLRTGAIEALTRAPTSVDAGWFGVSGARPRWSEDGEAVLLPGTFWSADERSPARPCGALYRVLRSGRSSCVEWLKADLGNHYEAGFHYITDLHFGQRDKNHVVVSFLALDGGRGTTEYRRTSIGRWEIETQPAVESSQLENRKFGVTVKEDLNEPPVLMVSEPKSTRSRVLWDPNPQLKDVAMGDAVVYTWKDSVGRQWKGGLYKPPNYKLGQRYPLVIQTHGFPEHEFRPSGVFPTAMAARALAGAGILVIQVGENVCPLATTEEASCSAGGYAAAVQQLYEDGLIDRDRIGIVGFSRTCYSVMQMLTTSSWNIRAAYITDGVMDDYLQYMLAVDLEGGNGLLHDFDASIGARPIGAGLQTWLQRSPLFNIEKVNAALRVVGGGELNVLFMWGPYAALRLLNKPTELVLLNTDEHVLTNPAVRLASQGGSVDWFRFWLQGDEDPDPAKAEQYRRWEKLCDMAVADNQTQPGFCVGTKH